MSLFSIFRISIRYGLHPIFSLIWLNQTYLIIFSIVYYNSIYCQCIIENFIVENFIVSALLKIS